MIHGRRTARGGWIGALLAATLVASPAAAQQPDFDERVGPSTLSVVAPILAAATEDSLPVGTLRAKVLEGVAKGVPAERIGPVVAALADELRAARSALRTELPGVAFGDGEIVAAAMAARHGVPFSALQSVWEVAGGRPLDVSVTVLGELVRRGVPVPEATTLLVHVTETNVPLALAAQIPGKFDGARGAGLSPVAALDEALRVLNIPDPPGRSRNR